MATLALIVVHSIYKAKVLVLAAALVSAHVQVKGAELLYGKIRTLQYPYPAVFVEQFTIVSCGSIGQAIMKRRKR